MDLGLGLAAMAFWAFIAACVVGGIWDSIRKREAQHETLRRMIESGQDIDQALMDKLLGTGKQVDRDLKIGGLIVVCVAPGLAALGILVSKQNPDALFPLLGVAALVACVGIGLLVASYFVGRSYREDKAAASERPMA
jgi:hypothetical protein